jgi:hypothetical protein
VLQDEAGCGSGSDEGRAMMQIIHDVAPGASQAFHTAFNGSASFASGIEELASVAGADIINDDVIYLAEPMFQDGIIAQAVDTVADIGVAYFSSAGSDPNSSTSIAGLASGDINGDGGVDAADIVLAYRIAVNELTPTTNQVLRGDIAPLSGGVSMPDGVINAADLLVIQQLVLEIR